MSNEHDFDPTIEIRPLSLSDIIELAEIEGDPPSSLDDRIMAPSIGAEELWSDFAAVRPDVQPAVVAVLRAIVRSRKRAALERPNSERNVGENGAGGDA